MTDKEYQAENIADIKKNLRELDRCLHEIAIHKDAIEQSVTDDYETQIITQGYDIVSSDDYLTVSEVLNMLLHALVGANRYALTAKDTLLEMSKMYDTSEQHECKKQIIAEHENAVEAISSLRYKDM